MAIFADRYCYVAPTRSFIRGKRETLLWPVYVWRVLYPDDRQRIGINLFQETLLGLIRTGIRDTEKLSELMALEPELVRFIIATQLQPNGWVNSQFKVTPNGEKLLDEAEDSRFNLTMGYAFQDAVAGNWLPRFTTVLSEIEPIDRDRNNRPIFELNKDSGRQERPFLLNHRAAPKADLGLLLPAYRQYRQELAMSGGESRDGCSEVILHSIECLDEEPARIYLWCELYRDEEGLQRWLVSDPFRVRPAVAWLREPLLELAKNNSGVANLMQRLLPEVPAEGITADRWLASIAEQAELEIDANYPFLSREPLIREHLTRVLRLKGRLERGETAHSEALGGLMIEAANLLEAVLKWLLREWQALPPWPRKARNWSRAEAKAELGALNLTAITPDLINLLAGQQRIVISKALDAQNQPLKALLAGTLFSANERDDHPYHEISQESLQLERLPKLADYRNIGGHSSGEKADLGVALEYADFAIQWMALFNRWY